MANTKSIKQKLFDLMLSENCSLVDIEQCIRSIRGDMNTSPLITGIGRPECIKTPYVATNEYPVDYVPNNFGATSI